MPSTRKKRFRHSPEFLRFVGRHHVGLFLRQRMWRWPYCSGRGRGKYRGRTNYMVGNAAAVAAWWTARVGRYCSYERVNDAADSLGLEGGTAGGVGPRVPPVTSPNAGRRVAMLRLEAR